MNKQDQINRLQFRIERIESHLAEQHKGNNFNLSEKPNSYDHLLPEGYEFCTEEEAVKWVKVKLVQDGKNELPLGATVPDCTHVESLYRPIRPIQYHVAVHEAVTVEPNPYAVDWANAPEEADCHAFDKSGKGWFYGVSFNDSFWYAAVFNSSGFTLPTGLDWKQSKTTRP
jgi:hypothetical protein